MVISFSVSKVRNQLLNEGEVYTYRWVRRKKTGKDWANSGRGTKKITDVFIEEMFQAPPTRSLYPYRDKSGFKTLWDWQCVIEDMRRGVVSDGWLYRVTVYPKVSDD